MLGRPSARPLVLAPEGACGRQARGGVGPGGGDAIPAHLALKPRPLAAATHAVTPIFDSVLRFRWHPLRRHRNGSSTSTHRPP